MGHINTRYGYTAIRASVRTTVLLAILLTSVLFAIHPNDGKQKEDKPGNTPLVEMDSITAKVWLDSARYFIQSNHPEDAVGYLQRTMELSRSIDFEQGIVGSYLALADLYGAVTMTRDQHQLISLAQDWSAGNKLDHLHVLSSHKLADYYLKLQNLDDAEETYQEVYQQYVAVSDSIGMSRVLMSLGDIRRDRDLYSDAGAMYQDALRIQVRYHLYEDITETYLRLAALNLDGADLVSARKELAGAAMYAPYALDSTMQLLTGIEFVKYYLADCDFDSAIYVSDQLLSQIDHKVSEPYALLLEQLYLVHLGMSHDSVAWSIFQKYTAVRQDLARIEDMKRARIFAALSGLDAISVELSGLEASIHELSTREFPLNGAIMAMVLALLAGGVGGFMLYVQYEKLSRTAQRMQQRVNRQAMYLTDINRFLEEFSYMTAHDLRSPVTNLLGLLSIVRPQEIESPVNYQYHQDMKRSSFRMLHVLNSLNDILRMQHLGREKPEWIDLNQITKSVAAQVKSEIDDFENPVVVTAETGATVLYPKRQLESILHSLLLFSASRVRGFPNANVWVTAVNEGSYSRITCAYPVNAIPTEDASLVFQLGNTPGITSEEFPTGLYNVHLLANVHGGSATVSLMPSGGNLFTVLVRNFAS